MKGRRYYAIEHTYGRGMGDGAGRHIGTYLAFETRAARDKWVGHCNVWVNQPGYREAITVAEMRHNGVNSDGEQILPGFIQRR